VVGHTLVRNSAVYAGSSVARNAIPLLLIPVLTRFLSPADFGTVALFEVTLAMGLVLVGLNMHGAIGVNFFRIDRTELRVYIGNVILVSIVASVVMLGLALLALQILPFKIPVVPTRWIPLIALAAFSQVLVSIALTLWQVEQRPIPYGLFQILLTALNVGLSLLFVVTFGWGWRGRVLGIVIASIAFGAVSFLVLYRMWCVRLTARREYIKDALMFGIPLVPHALGNWILTGIDRIFIASLVGIGATGVYTVGYQVGMIVGLVATSFNQAWSPFLFQKLKEDDARSKVRIVKFTYGYFVAIAAFAVILGFIAPWFLAIFVGPRFRGAYQYVIWIALGYAANGMYLMVAHYVFYAKKTHLLAGVTFISAIANILLNFLLIRANGPIGAAQASTVSFAISFVLTWILAARVYDMPWRVWRTRQA
jgi:O-antigen/teichoic acid export membrane protein